MAGSSWVYQSAEIQVIYQKEGLHYYIVFLEYWDNFKDTSGCFFPKHRLCFLYLMRSADRVVHPPTTGHQMYNNLRLVHVMYRIVVRRSPQSVRCARYTLHVQLCDVSYVVVEHELHICSASTQTINFHMQTQHSDSPLLYIMKYY